MTVEIRIRLPHTASERDILVDFLLAFGDNSVTWLISIDLVLCDTPFYSL